MGFESGSSSPHTSELSPEEQAVALKILGYSDAYPFQRVQVHLEPDDLFERLQVSFRIQAYVLTRLGQNELHQYTRGGFLQDDLTRKLARIRDRYDILHISQIAESNAVALPVLFMPADPHSDRILSLAKERDSLKAFCGAVDGFAPHNLFVIRHREEDREYWFRYTESGLVFPFKHAVSTVPLSQHWKPGLRDVYTDTRIPAPLLSGAASRRLLRIFGEHFDFSALCIALRKSGLDDEKLACLSLPDVLSAGTIIKSYDVNDDVSGAYYCPPGFLKAFHHRWWGRDHAGTKSEDFLKKQTLRHQAVMKTRIETLRSGERLVLSFYFTPPTEINPFRIAVGHDEAFGWTFFPLAEGVQAGNENFRLICKLLVEYFSLRVGTSTRMTERLGLSVSLLRSAGLNVLSGLEGRSAFQFSSDSVLLSSDRLDVPHDNDDESVGSDATIPRIPFFASETAMPDSIDVHLEDVLSSSEADLMSHTRSILTSTFLSS